MLRRMGSCKGVEELSFALEYIQGMTVVKAFELGERAGKAVDNAIYESAEANIVLEKVFSSLAAAFQTVFKFIRAAIVVAAPYLFFNGRIDAEKCLLLLVASFMIYSSVELAGSTAAVRGYGQGGPA